MQPKSLLLQGVYSDTSLSMQPDAQSGTVVVSAARATTVAVMPTRYTGLYFILEKQVFSMLFEGESLAGSTKD